MKADVLKKLRKDSNLTQEQLAKKIGVTRSLIGMVESGKQEGGRDFTRKVAEHFNVSIDYLEGLTEESITNNDESLVKDLLVHLYKSGLIKDINNIDDTTKDMIMGMVKKELEIISKSKK